METSKYLTCNSCDTEFKWSKRNERQPTFCPNCGDRWNSRTYAPGVFHPFVLAQDEIWIDKDGISHDIVDMPRAYIANVVGFLFANAQRFRNAYVNYGIVELANDLGGKDPSARWLRQPLSNVMSREQDNSWITRSPLFQALIEELQG